MGVGNLGLRAADGASSPGLGVTIGEPNDLLSVFRWALTQVTGVFIHDQYCEPTNIPAIIQKEVEMGGTYTPAQMGFYVTTSNVNLTWTSSDTNILTVNSEGKVTAHKRGVADITASGSANGEQYQIKINITSIETVYVKNFYDSTYAGNTEKIKKISTVVSFLNSVYFSEFQLKFVMDGAPVYYQYAGVDICPLGEGDCNSSCGTSCLSHHKNIARIAVEMYNNYFESNHIVVMWSDSDEDVFCIQEDNGHTAIDALAATLWSDEQPIPVIQVFRNDALHEVESMAINLAHEVAHTLGLKEIYYNNYFDDEVMDNGKTKHSDFVFGFHCIMQKYGCYNISDLYSSELSGEKAALCDYCKGKLDLYMQDDVYES